MAYLFLTQHHNTNAGECCETTTATANTCDCCWKSVIAFFFFLFCIKPALVLLQSILLYVLKGGKYSELCLWSLDLGPFIKFVPLALFYYLICFDQPQTLVDWTPKLNWPVNQECLDSLPLDRARWIAEPLTYSDSWMVLCSTNRSAVWSEPLCLVFTELHEQGRGGSVVLLEGEVRTNQSVTKKNSPVSVK